MSGRMYHCILFSFCFFSFISGSYGRKVALQIFETSIRKAEDLKLLNVSKIDASSLSPTCAAEKFLNENKNHSLTENSITIEEITFDNATIKRAKENSSLIQLELNMTFPLRRYEESFSIYMPQALTMKISLFIIHNYTRDFCNEIQCPKDPLCLSKMDPIKVENNIKKWIMAERKKSNMSCKYATLMGIFAVHEGKGNISVIKVARKENKVALDAILELNEWSSALPETFFKGFANANMTFGGTSLVATYTYEVSKETSWFLTTDGIANLVLMGILGFNLIVILFALLFWACNRSRRAFDMDIWSFALSSKKKDNTEEF